MPQLDKYIFFNHVITLTIFFTLIYMFLRKEVITNISLINKYRKNILLDKIFLDIKKLENPLKNLDKLPINSTDVPYYYSSYSLEDFKQFNPIIDESFEKANLRWEFTFVIFSFISTVSVENVFKNFVKKTINSLYNFSNFARHLLSIQLLNLFYNLTNRGLFFLNSADVSENLDLETTSLKEFIKN